MNIWEKLTNTHDNKVETLKEFNRRFYNTVLGFKDNKTNQYEFLRYKHYNEDLKTQQFLDPNEQTISIPYEEISPQKIIFIPRLEKGFYKTKENKIIYVTKRSIRQWRRGICEDNYKLLNFSLCLTTGTNYKTVFYPDIYTILNLHYNNTTNIEKDLSLFKTCDVYRHCVINKDFLLTHSILLPEGYSLFFHKYLVGHFKTPTELTINSNIFFQEILEEIATWNFKINLKFKDNLNDISNN